MKHVRVVAALLAVAVTAADQLAGWLVRREAEHLPWTLGRELAIRLSHNTGISFSRLSHSGDWLRVADRPGLRRPGGGDLAGAGCASRCRWPSSSGARPAT